ncbi:transcription elongation factor [Conidiobolus coronatus NRRL 28638]|uniref:Transcription elongation factor n=1 Tax=Conidiobolus coronatus (strain ATCC 28846 / CBS 209.66 / NRRL 28638) TaxID=796925 RepID=A0A137PBT0_CONC2|nr:transcription elongation factor [Conidiobolus coronatus NRRL 28638]|eukprot:KXN72426.1 transcription elongation factor [Conidiobolus coronatus NRRL 28638]
MTTMASNEKLIDINKKLTKSMESQNTQVIVELLKDLGDLKVTPSGMKASKIGLTVAKLRKDTNTKISKLASDLILEWKNAVKEVKESRSNPGSFSEKDPKPPKLETRKSISQRTIHSDNVKYIPIGNDTRDKSLGLIYSNLALEDSSESSLVYEKAQEVEKAVFDLDPIVGDAYTIKIRSLAGYLRQNASGTLRARILTGELSGETFINMKPIEFASSEIKAEIKKIEDQNLFNMKGAGNVQAETDAFKCGKCHQRKCTYYQMQTRSADEPMTTFVTCTNCNNRWKVILFI